METGPARDFIARQLARTPEERLVVAALGRRVAALRAWKGTAQDTPSAGPGSESESPGGPEDR